MLVIEKRLAFKSEALGVTGLHFVIVCVIKKDKYSNNTAKLEFSQLAACLSHPSLSYLHTDGFHKTFPKYHAIPKCIL